MGGSAGGGGRRARRSPGGFTSKQLEVRGVDPEDIRRYGPERISLSRPTTGGFRDNPPKASRLGGDPDGAGSAEMWTRQPTARGERLRATYTRVLLGTDVTVPANMALANRVFRAANMRIRWPLSRKRGRDYWVI